MDAWIGYIFFSLAFISGQIHSLSVVREMMVEGVFNEELCSVVGIGLANGIAQSFCSETVDIVPIICVI